MSLQDNRLRFPPTEIDFANDVGLTGEAHDNYPAPGDEARYDFARMVVISLLSNQSSDPDKPPTQFREGTIWFNKTEYKRSNGTTFDDIAKAIYLRLSPIDPGISLYEWYNDAVSKLTRIQPRYTYSGKVQTYNIHQLPIPDAIRQALAGISALMQPIVYVNGLLIDPRLCKLTASCPLFVDIDNSIILNKQDKFSVIIERFDISVLDEIVA
jgi:hypothetical protein